MCIPRCARCKCRSVPYSTSGTCICTASSSWTDGCCSRVRSTSSRNRQYLTNNKLLFKHFNFFRNWILMKKKRKNLCWCDCSSVPACRGCPAPSRARSNWATAVEKLARSSLESSWGSFPGRRSLWSSSARDAASLVCWIFSLLLLLPPPQPTTTTAYDRRRPSTLSLARSAACPASWRRCPISAK